MRERMVGVVEVVGEDRGVRVKPTRLGKYRAWVERKRRGGERNVLPL